MSFIRFRLRVNAGDFGSEAPFLLRDLLVERLAPRTCKMLLEMPEASSLYPSEMDLLFADPMIFEVVKFFSDSSVGAASYEVLDVFTHHSLFDVFLNPIPYNAGGELEDQILDAFVASLYDDSAVDYEMIFGVDEPYYDGGLEDPFADSCFEVGSTSRVDVGDKRKISDVLDEVDEEALALSERVSRAKNV